MRDEIAISESIEIAEDSEKCTYFHLKFSGAEYAPQLRKSQHGFIFRGRIAQSVGFLVEELKKIKPNLTYGSSAG